jgi:hypothetical protein
MNGMKWVSAVHIPPGAWVLLAVFGCGLVFTVAGRFLEQGAIKWLRLSLPLLIFLACLASLWGQPTENSWRQGLAEMLLGLSFLWIVWQMFVFGLKKLPAWTNRHPKLTNSVSLAFLLFIAGAVVNNHGGDVLIYLAPSSPYGYAFKYSVDTSNVRVEKQPHDCEWASAPLGGKHCHYKAEVSSVRTGTSANGNTPLVSYDEGRTWSVNPQRVKPSVFVSWTKVEE